MSNVDLFVKIVYLKILTYVEVISEKVWIFRYYSRNFKFSILVNDTKLKFGRIEDMFLFFSVPETSSHNIHKM